MRHEVDEHNCFVAKVWNIVLNPLVSNMPKSPAIVTAEH